MPSLTANGVELAYEAYGDPEDPPLLMIQGLGMPLSGWPAAFIEMIAAHGLRVILFDNRDIGRSQLLDDLRMPNVALQILKRKIGLRAQAPYQLRDMMRDAAALLDGLHIRTAHVIGVSMGGMIAQLLAINAPDRVLSLTSIMSTTGNRHLPGTRKDVSRHIMKGPAESTPDGRMQYHLQLWRLIGSPKYPTPDEQRREWLQRLFDRGMTANGSARQMLAIAATPDRTLQLMQLHTPTLVIHGDADPLVPVACGRATAQAIPASELVIIPGMGHDLPEAVQPRIIELIVSHVRVAEVVRDVAA